MATTTTILDFFHASNLPSHVISTVFAPVTMACRASACDVSSFHPRPTSFGHVCCLIFFSDLPSTCSSVSFDERTPAARAVAEEVIVLTGDCRLSGTANEEESGVLPQWQCPPWHGCEVAWALPCPRWSRAVCPPHASHTCWAELFPDLRGHRGAADRLVVPVVAMGCNVALFPVTRDVT